MIPSPGEAALPFPHLKVFEHYTVFWPRTLAIKPTFLASVQNGTLLTGTFQGSEVSAWLSQGALRQPLSFEQVEKEWDGALAVQMQFEKLTAHSLGCRKLAPGWTRCLASGAMTGSGEKPSSPRYVAQAMYFDSGRARILLQARSGLSEKHAQAFLEQFSLNRTLPAQKVKKLKKTAGGSP